MKDEFIPYEQALEFKALGFNEPCLASRDMNNGEGLIQLPLYQQSFRWFREKYNLVHEISWSKSKSGVSFDYDIFSLVLPTDDELGNEDDVYIDRPMETYDSLAEKTFRDTEFNSYEETELACINKLIKICKKYINL
jgi:hypothetical protein